MTPQHPVLGDAAIVAEEHRLLAKILADKPKSEREAAFSDPGGWVYRVLIAESTSKARDLNASTDPSLTIK